MACLELTEVRALEYKAIFTYSKERQCTVLYDIGERGRQGLIFVSIQKCSVWAPRLKDRAHNIHESPHNRYRVGVTVKE